MKKYIHKPSILRRTRLWMMTFLLIVVSNFAFAQAIQVLNILETGRSNGTAVTKGYNLAGNTSGQGNMIDARAKLTNLANFGPSDTVNRQLVITDAYGTIGSIPNVAALNAYDIIYIGTYYRNSSTAAISPTEVTNLLNWSLQPGKVLMVQEQATYSVYNHANPVSTAMGYGITSNSTYPDTSSFLADNEQNTKLFSGIFGSVTGTISQSGLAQGYFSSGCDGIPIAGNGGGFATMVLNQKYRDVLVADTGYFVYLSDGSTYMSSGSGISTNADKVWANLWAWAVNEVVNQVAPSAFITKAGEAYSDDLPICPGSSINVKLRNNNAAIRNWETSTDNGASWTSIASTANSITYANPVANQQFRAVVGNPGCTVTSSAVVVTVFNASAPTVTSSLANVCPATTVNLDSAHTGTKPAGTNLVWFTNNAHSGTALTAAQVANAGAGTYYAFYQSTSNTNCYSAASNAVTVTIDSCVVCNAGNSAPEFNNYVATDYYYIKNSSAYGIFCGGGATADLTVLVPWPAAPSGTVLTWHTGTPATDSNKLTPAQVAALTGATRKIYAAFWDSANGCYSPTKLITVYAPICATDDDFTATPIISGVGGTLPSLFANDTFKGITLSTLPPNSVHWIGELWTHPVAQVDLVNAATYGALTISASLAPGPYEYMYSINDNSPDATPLLSKSTAYVKFKVICKAGETAPSVNSSLSNICPATTANLDSAHTGTEPAGTDLLWFTNNTHSGTALTASQVANAGAGTYYAFYYSSVGTCYSPASNPVTVTINTCPTPNLYQFRE
jgi:hypothetical protein